MKWHGESFDADILGCFLGSTPLVLHKESWISLSRNPEGSVRTLSLKNPALNSQNNTYSYKRTISINRFYNLAMLILSPGGGVLPYMRHIGMCRLKGMAFKQFTLA